jgi:hypothetical protein
VVIAVPLFIVLFVRTHLYYVRVAKLLGFDVIPDKPVKSRTQVIVPVTMVSFLVERAVSEALSLGQEVICVTVVMDGGEGDTGRERQIRDEWAKWNPGVSLRVLHTQYASVVEPIVAFIDDVRSKSDDQIVVLIPVVAPRHLRHRLLHNHIDSVLTAALKKRTDLVVARVVMPLEE